VGRNVCGHHIVQRYHLHTDLFAARESLDQASCEPRNRSPRLFQPDSWFKTSDNRQKEREAAVCGAGRETQRYPNFSAGSGELKRCGYHAYQLVQDAVQADVPAQ
jgi:hypothetical protein